MAGRVPLPLESAGVRGRGVRGGHDQLPRLGRLRPGIHRRDFAALGRPSTGRPAKGLGRGAEAIPVSRRQRRLRARRELWRLHGLLDGRRVEQALEVLRRSRRRIRCAHDVLRDRRVVVRRTRERRYAMGASGELREVQSDRSRQGMARADADHPRQPRLPHPGFARHRRVHRTAAARHPQRVPQLPRRGPLGTEAAEQRAVAQGRDRLAQEVDGTGRLRRRLRGRRFAERPERRS